MNLDEFKQSIQDYISNLTEDEMADMKRKTNWEFYNSKLFKGISLFSDQTTDPPKIGDREKINNIYDSEGNVVETGVEFEFTEHGWRRV